MKQREGGRRMPLLMLPVLASLLILAVVYALAGLFPFGVNTLAWGDFSSQVVPFLTQLGGILRGEAGALYSMQNAGGMSFTGVFLYFLASPFSLLTVFVPRGYYYELANVLVALKIITAACTATLLFANRRMPFAVGRMNAGILGVMYAFGGYSFLYYQNNVWLDAMYLLPLIALSVLMLAVEGRILPFAFSFAAMVVCQFQLAYMVGIALAILMAMYVAFFAARQTARIVSLRFVGGLLLALLFSAAAWLPALYQYAASARTGTFTGAYNPEVFLADYYTTTPVVLCTSAVLAAVVWLLVHKGWKNKPVRFCLLAFALLCVPLLVEPVNLMWHGGSFQSFPSRYGFITLLLGLTLVAAALAQLRQLPAPMKSGGVARVCTIGAIVLFAGFLLFVLLLYGQEASAYTRSLWGSKESLITGAATCLVGAVVLLLLFLLRARLVLTRRLAAAVLLFAVLAQGVYNGMVYMGAPAYDAGNHKAYIGLSGGLEDVRVKNSRMYWRANDIGAMGYASLGHYSSFTRDDMLSAYKKLGYGGSWMELSGYGGTLLSDYFLNVGGVITRNDGIDPMYNEENTLLQSGEYTLQQQPVGGYATVVQAIPAAIALMPEGDRFDIQQWLYQALYNGGGELFTRYQPTSLERVELVEYDWLDKYGVWRTGDGQPGEIWYSIEVGERETLYFDCFRFISNALEEVVNDAMGVTVNGTSLEVLYPNAGANGILCLGTFENETVEIRVNLWRDCLCRSFGVAGIKQSTMQALYQTTGQPQTSIKGAEITVQAQAGADDLLVLALGYDEGFTATVNGRQAEVYRVLDGYMAVRLQAGENMVRLVFFPRGLRAGLLLTGIGLLLAAALVLWRRKKPLSAPLSDGLLRLGGVCKPLVCALGALVFFVAYILPLGLWLYVGPH